MYVVDTDRNNYPEFDVDGVDIWEVNLRRNGGQILGLGSGNDGGADRD